MGKFDELKSKLASLEDDANEFYNKENKSAGVRLRKGLQEIKALAQAARQEVSDKTKSIQKTKKA